MAGTGAAGAAGRHWARRARRAQRRNAARQALYVDRLVRWRRVAAQLERAEQTGRQLADGRRLAGAPASPPIELLPGERVLAALPALTLVEVPRAARRPSAGYAGYSPRRTAELRPGVPVLATGPQRVRGQGPVTVTDRRIVFHGPKDRTEWPLDRLVRIEHARRRPVSLLHLAGRRAVYGLLYRVRDAGQVRVVLELAAADRDRDRPGDQPAGPERVLARVAADRHRHALDRPRPPQWGGPDQAPGLICLVRRVSRAAQSRPAGRRPGWRLAQATLTALALIVAVGVALPHRPAPETHGDLTRAALPTAATTPVPAQSRNGSPPSTMQAPPGAPAPAAGTRRTPPPRQHGRRPAPDRDGAPCRSAPTGPAGHQAGGGPHGHPAQFCPAWLRAASPGPPPAAKPADRHAWVNLRRATGHVAHPWAGQRRSHGGPHRWGTIGRAAT